MYSRQTTQNALWFDISGLSFKPVNDVGPMIDYCTADLLARTLVVWLTTTILGGVALAANIAFVARVFRVPEFAEHQPMGFLMACVLGLGLAAWFLISSLRELHRSR